MSKIKLIKGSYSQKEVKRKIISIRHHKALMLSNIKHQRYFMGTGVLDSSYGHQNENLSDHVAEMNDPAKIQFDLP